MASLATSATSFELIEDQTLTVEEVEIASQEAQDIRTREAAVAAGLVLDEPEAPPSASATDVMNDPSGALERLQVAFATPTPGLGAPGPAEEGDRDMEDADGAERATPPEEAQTPPTKRLKGFVAASQKATSQANKPVTLVPVDGKPGYFKLVDLPDLFPVLPASAATLLRDITVEEAVSLFYRSPEAAKQCWVCPGKESAPFQAPSATYEADGITYNLLILEGKPSPVVPWHRPTTTWWTARSWGEPLQKRTRLMRSPWQMRSRLTCEADDEAGPGKPGDPGQSAAVPERGGGSELRALPSPGGPGDQEEGGAA